jgi:hypothetical protein
MWRAAPSLAFVCACAPHVSEPAELYDRVRDPHGLGDTVRVRGIAGIVERSPETRSSLAPTPRGGLLVPVRPPDGLAGLGVTCALGASSAIPWPGQSVVVAGKVVWDPLEEFPLVLEDCTLSE